MERGPGWLGWLPLRRGRGEGVQPRGQARGQELRPPDNSPFTSFHPSWQLAASRGETAGRNCPVGSLPNLGGKQRIVVQQAELWGGMLCISRWAVQPPTCICTCPSKDLHAVFIATSFVIMEHFLKLKKTQWPSTVEWVSKLCYIYAKEYYRAMKSIKYWCTQQYGYISQIWYWADCVLSRSERVSHLVVSGSVTPRTVARQPPLSMGFSRQEYWSGLLFPSPGDLPGPGIEPGSPALQADSLLSEPQGSLCSESIYKKLKNKQN